VCSTVAVDLRQFFAGEMVCNQDDKPGINKINHVEKFQVNLVQRIAKVDLQYKTFCRREVQLFSDADKIKQVEASKRPQTTDEKEASSDIVLRYDFTVQATTNTQNDSVTPEWLASMKSQHNNSCCKIAVIFQRVLWWF